MPRRVAGLRSFLGKATLSTHVAEAEEYCCSCGAIDVREILEEDELCDGLAERLQLKKLERRRFDAAVLAARADPGALSDGPAQEAAPGGAAREPAARPGAAPLAAADPGPAEAEGRLFGGGGWGGASRRRGAGAGRGARGRGPARPYFDAEEEEPEASGAHAPANHYFGAPAARAEDDASAEAGAPRGHYFQEPAPLARGGGAEARASGGRSPYVGEADGGVLSEEVLQRFQPFFDAVEVVTPAQRCSAAAFLDEHGATAPEDLVLCGLAEAFTAALELKPVPRAKAARFWQQLSAACGPCAGTGAHGPAAPPAAPAPRAPGAARGRGAGGAVGGHYFGAPSAGEAGEPPPPPPPASEPGAAAGAAAPARGVGAHIRSFEGELWGRVVGQDVRNWKLASGRSAKKETFGVKWYWDAEGPPEGSPPAAPAAGPSQDALGPSALDALAERRRRDEAALAARREAAKQGRRTRDVRAQVEREEGVRQDDEERRIDPYGDRPSTLRELRQRYAKQFSEAEVLEYWRRDCRPLPPSGERPADAAAAALEAAALQVRQGAAPAAAAAPQGGGARDPDPRRTDPDDGRPYTYAELCRKYRQAFSEPEISDYWRQECRPVVM